jgi:hypothetical protein
MRIQNQHGARGIARAGDFFYFLRYPIRGEGDLCWTLLRAWWVRALCPERKSTSLGPATIRERVTCVWQQEVRRQARLRAGVRSMVRWRQSPVPGNVDDRPSSRIPGGATGGAGGIIVFLILLVAIILGVDPGAVFQGTEIPSGSTGQSSSLSPSEEQQLTDFSSQVLGDTDTTWSQILAEDLGQTYVPPRLVLYTGNVQSACGRGSAAVGLFYCPSDQRIYIDPRLLP